MQYKYLLPYGFFREYKDESFEPIPITKKVTKEQLNELLINIQRNIWFCWHNWVYWKYGDETKQHRVCKRCRRKEQNNNTVNGTPVWNGSKYV